MLKEKEQPREDRPSMEEPRIGGPENDCHRFNGSRVGKINK